MQTALAELRLRCCPISRRPAWLRKQLIATPSWANGHRYLALTELELLHGAAPDPRTLATIRVSLQAARTLLQQEKLAPQVSAELQYVDAMVLFFEQHHQDALKVFAELLGPQTAPHLREPLRVTAAESAAAAAMALGEHQLAQKVLHAIPESLRSADVRALLK